MKSTTLSAEISGLENLGDALTQVLRDAQRQAIEEMFARLRAEERLQFATADWFAAWPPRVKNAPWPLLQKTGWLRDSLSDQSHPLHVEQILAGEGSQVTGIFGTAVKYAQFINEGTRHLPPRQLLPDVLGQS